MYAPVYPVRPAGSILLGDDHHRTAGDPVEDPHGQADHRAGAAHRRQRRLAHEAAHHHGIHRVIQLLKKRAQPKGKEKSQQLFPDDPFGRVHLSPLQSAHGRSRPV